MQSSYMGEIGNGYSMQKPASNLLVAPENRNYAVGKPLGASYDPGSPVAAGPQVTGTQELNLTAVKDPIVMPHKLLQRAESSLQTTPENISPDMYRRLH